MSEEGSEEREPIRIKDSRKIDPVTGQARKAAAGDPAAAAGDHDLPATESGQVPLVEATLLDERTHDLQRVQAEYANYRKRADRERLVAGELAVGRVLAELLPVLDNLERARQHGDLTGGLKAVADQIETVVEKFGLAAFGEVGDPFDPAIHEAVLHAESGEVTEPTCTTIMRAGYRLGERLLRPAMVGVTDPAAASATEPAEAQPAADSVDDAGDPTTQAE